MLYFQKLSIFRESDRADIDSRLTFALPNCYVCPCKAKFTETKIRHPKKVSFLYSNKGMVNRPDFQKVLTSRRWKCGSCRT